MPEIFPTEFSYDEGRLLAFAKEHCDRVDKLLREKEHETWVPELWVMLKDPVSGEESYQVFALMVPFNTHEEKHGVLNRIGREIYEGRRVPVLVFFASEAWASSNPKYSAGNGSLPEHDPHRREVVTCVAATFGSKHVAHFTVPVTRNAKGAMRPGRASAIVTEGVRWPLINALWYGFAKAANFPGLN